MLKALLVHSSMLLVGTVLFILACSAPVHAHILAGLAALISAVGTIGIVTNTHTSSHFAVSAHRRTNELLTFFGYPICIGFSATYWWHDHIAGHHVWPNVTGMDDDFDFAPIFAITAVEVSNSSGWLRRYYRHVQQLVLMPAVFMMGFNLQRNGWAHVLKSLASGPKRKRRHYQDLAALLLHITLFFLIPMMFVPFTHVLVFYCVRIALVSAGMFVLLIPAHFPAETPVLSRAQAERVGHCALQTLTTINYNGGKLVHWMASGLDYQIEHHLFPEINHIYYPAMSPLVREFCVANGLPYRRLGLGRALWKSILVFRDHKERMTLG